MKARYSLIVLLLVVIIYLSALLWIDSTSSVFIHLDKVLRHLPTLVICTASALIFRYLRWNWLLRRSGHKTKTIAGLLSYLSGFAFTATPGKIGELIRVKYFHALGVPAHKVVAVFIFERAFDLLSLLLMTLFFLANLSEHLKLLAIVSIFVVGMISIVVIFSLRINLVRQIAYKCESAGLNRITKLVRLVISGVEECSIWFTPVDLMVCLFLGLLAWSLMSYSLVYLASHLVVDKLSTADLFGIFPLATLAGAASMLPAGIGSTEATITALLTWMTINPKDAFMVAIVIRVTTLWFAIASGLVAIAYLEAKANNDSRKNIDR
jgi:uncharacterized protein (TIRG00374 family)